jgi:hypothetical protein
MPLRQRQLSTGRIATSAVIPSLPKWVCHSAVSAQYVVGMFRPTIPFATIAGMASLQSFGKHRNVVAMLRHTTTMRRHAIALTFNGRAKMRVGFTGTRPPFTNAQLLSLERIILTNRGEITEAHHGDCVGADEAFHIVCRTFNIPVIIHPPLVTTWNAYCGDYTEKREPKTYHERDQDIVNETDWLIACPKTFTPTPHSGTWYTAGYARAIGKPIWFVYPDGTVVPYKRQS